MERNKKNKIIDAAEPRITKSGSGDAEVKGGVTALTTDAFEQEMPAEINGPRGLEPTRYGDWEQKGRCTDF